MYDYYLGGSANFEVDRVAADEQLAMAPDVASDARANRAFLGRVVRYLSERGIDQFLDLGSGVPTVGNVHEVARERNPRAKIAYVDFEAVAVAHARRLVQEDPLISVDFADLQDPDSVLSSPGVTKLLDFTRPVAVLAISVLHFVPNERHPQRIIAHYRDACVPGSALGLSHMNPRGLPQELIDAGSELYQRTTTPLTFRSDAEIVALMEGYELVAPGMVRVDRWRSEDSEGPGTANVVGAVGILT